MFYLHRDVGLRLQRDVGPGLHQRRHVFRAAMVTVGLGLDAWQPLSRLAGLVPLQAQRGTL